MTAVTPVLPALMTQTTAFLLLSDALDRLNDAVTERQECGDCKAFAGWCDICWHLYLSAEHIGQAKTEVKGCLRDRDAREIVSRVMDLLSDRKRFGDASEVAFFGAAGGAL